MHLMMETHVYKFSRRSKKYAGSICSGIITDVKNRSKTYSRDWTDINKSKPQILSASIYIFLASVLPALAFGEQISAETNGILNVVHVLAATAIGGLLQALIGGQPLLIVGVAEPIVLVYYYLYKFAKDQTNLGAENFLAWAAWSCVWAGIILITLSMCNACIIINKFTRFAGESFGALIALLFMQQTVKGLVNEFKNPQNISPSQWKTINGLWGIVLCFGLLFSGLLLRRGRRWRFLNSFARSLITDYGVPFLIIAFSGLSYSVSGPDGVPTRVQAPNTWDVTSTWTVSRSMCNIPGKYIAGALVPGTIIAILFFFDHNVSSQLAQQKEFNLVKSSAYHWDLLLLGVLTIVLGVLGLPPINGVIPQSPMHTKALARFVVDTKDDKNIYNNNSGDTATTTTNHSDNNSNIPSDTANSNNDKNSNDRLTKNNNTVMLTVLEQRGSGLFQSLAVGTCLAIMPAIRCIPTAVLWGYFAFMAAESLPGSQLWDRTLLLLTDPKKRYLVLERGHSPYLETVQFRTIALFTLVQLCAVLAVYGLTWAGVAGVLFPLPIMGLVPLRHFILPRMFGSRAMDALDKMEEEEAAPLKHKNAVLVATAAGLVAKKGAVEIINEDGLSVDGNGVTRGGFAVHEEVLESEITHGHRVVHHVSEQELEYRRAARDVPSDQTTTKSGQDGSSV